MIRSECDWLLYRCPWLKTFYYILVVQSKANMESIGVLPEPDTVITGSRIELFGLLSQSKIETEQECHFCMEPVNNEMLYTTDTACCHQAIHCRCFETWAFTSIAFTNDLVIRCAYCRANYTYPCFLCLEDVTQSPQNPKTMCSHTTVHDECVQDLKYILSILSEDDFYLECGYLGCGCIWTKV